MDNSVQPGKYLDHVCVAAQVSGVAFLLGGMLVVPVSSGEIGDTISVSTCGVYELALNSGDTPGQGDPLYWSGSDLTTTPGANQVAQCAEAVASGTVVKALLGVYGV